MLSSVRAASTCASSVADSGTLLGTHHYAGRCGGLLRLHYRQISGLRELQNNLVDRNRKDSLQLLRIQNDLNTLALAMRDMLDNNGPYPLTAWSAQFQRVRDDLNDALRQEEQVAVADRTPEQRQYLEKFHGAILGRRRSNLCAGRERQAGRGAYPDPAFACRRGRPR